MLRCCATPIPARCADAFGTDRWQLDLRRTVRAAVERDKQVLVSGCCLCAAPLGNCRLTRLPRLGLSTLQVPPHFATFGWAVALAWADAEALCRAE
jgi:hypothetical protein